MTTAMKVHGTDLSHHNPDPDLRRAKSAGLLWLYHKATEGVSFVDSKYGERRRAAEAAGLPFGAYHFARPDSDGRDAVTEARWFIQIANPKAGDLVPVLDFEVSHPRAEEWSKVFMAEVERLLKRRGLVGKPLHYGPDDFGKDYPYHRWVPRYNNSNTRPTVPFDIWQFSDGQYGVPNSFPGLGNVDLNNMRDGFSLSDFRLRERGKTNADKKRKTHKLHLAHISMQFSDNPDQMRHDVAKLFRRAKERNYAWITGTEAGPGADPLRDILADACKENKYILFVPKSPTDAWVAVNKEYVKGNKVTTRYEPIIPGSSLLNVKGSRWGPKGITSISFETPDKIGIGPVSVGSSHYLTKGRSPKNSPKAGDKTRYEWNKKLGLAVGDWAIEHGKGRGLAFYGGDQNMVDRITDTFFGAPLTSAWDELGRYANTGHGNIDVIASYDRDGRVKATYVRALDDRKFFLHTDHYLVEAGYEVEVLS